MGKTGSPADAEDHEALRLAEISDVLRSRAGKAPVCCQGSVTLDAPPVVFGPNNAGEAFALQLPAQDNGALKPLLDACVPATFGRGSEEVRCPAQSCGNVYMKHAVLPCCPH